MNDPINTEDNPVVIGDAGDDDNARLVVITAFREGVPLRVGDTAWVAGSGVEDGLGTFFIDASEAGRHGPGPEESQQSDIERYNALSPENEPRAGEGEPEQAPRRAEPEPEAEAVDETDEQPRRGRTARKG